MQISDEAVEAAAKAVLRGNDEGHHAYKIAYAALEAAAPHMLPDEAARVGQVSDIVAAIEDIILDKAGTNVLRSGRDGSFTSAGGRVARLIDAALTKPNRSQL